MRKVVFGALFLLLVAPVCAGGEEPTPQELKPPFLVVFDFRSAFDDNQLGAKAAQVLRGHAQRTRHFELLADLEREGRIPEDDTFWGSVGAQTDRGKIIEYARKNFAGVEIIAWGEVFPKPGKDSGWELELFVADLRPQPPQELLHQRYHCPNKHWIPVRIDEVLSALLGKRIHRGLDADPQYRVVSENLVQNPGFQTPDPQGGAGGRPWPAHWTDTSMKKKQAWWVPKEGGPPGDMCLKLAPDREMADSYGLIVYSDYLPVKKGAYYRLAADLMTRNPSIIVWVKGYSLISGQLRNTYKHQKRFYPEKKGVWQNYRTVAFCPRHPRHEVTAMRVMLYAYHPAGEAFFDNVDLRQVELLASETPREADFERPETKTEGWEEAR